MNLVKEVACCIFFGDEFYREDYNGQSCGGVQIFEKDSSETQDLKPEKGKRYEFFTTPSSCRECADGTLKVEIIDLKETEERGGTTYALLFLDTSSWGWIGDYPNYKWVQSAQPSGYYQIVIRKEVTTSEVTLQEL